MLSSYHRMPTDGFYINAELNQVGNIDTKGHNSLWGRVYSTDGIAPTQNAKGGGAGAKTGLFNVGYIKKDREGRRVYSNKGVSPTLTSNDTGGALPPLIKSTQIDKDVHNPLKGRTKYGWHFEQKVYSKESPCTRALTSSSGSGSREKVLTDDAKIRRLTPREVSRVQGDFEDKFNFDGFSDTKAYEFSGNAMDISTTRNLTKEIKRHIDGVAHKANKQITLF